MDCVSCSPVVVAQMPPSYDAAIATVQQQQTDIGTSIWVCSCLLLFALGLVAGRLR